MQVKLCRDDARMIQSRVFPYLHQLCSLKIRETSDHMEKLHAIAIKSVVNRIEYLFGQRLLGNALKFKMRLADHEAIIFYMMLTTLPIDKTEYYFYAVISNLIAALYQESLMLMIHYPGLQPA